MPHGVLLEGTCLGVPQRVLFECFVAFFGKKIEKNTLCGTPSQVPKIAPKSTPWGTFRLGPWSTPVNGGRDHKFSEQSVSASDFATHEMEDPLKASTTPHIVCATPCSPTGVTAIGCTRRGSYSAKGRVSAF